MSTLVFNPPPPDAGTRHILQNDQVAATPLPWNSIIVFAFSRKYNSSLLLQLIWINFLQFVCLLPNNQVPGCSSPDLKKVICNLIFSFFSAVDFNHEAWSLFGLISLWILRPHVKQQWCQSWGSSNPEPLDPHISTGLVCYTWLASLRPPPKTTLTGGPALLDWLWQLLVVTTGWNVNH